MKGTSSVRVSTLHLSRVQAADNRLLEHHMHEAMPLLFSEEETLYATTLSVLLSHN